MDLKKIMNRRSLLQMLGLTGLTGTVLVHQNCSDVGFKTSAEDRARDVQGTPNIGGPSPAPTPGATSPPVSPTDPNLAMPGDVNSPLNGQGRPQLGYVADGKICDRPLSLYDLPAKPIVPNATLSMVGNQTINLIPDLPIGMAADHNPNAKFYAVPFYDHVSNTLKTQHLLTVDVGANPPTSFHAVASSNFLNLNINSDLHVFRKDNGQLIHWRRFGSSDSTPSAMIMLDSALVTAGVKLLVVVSCLSHGHFAQEVDLGKAPLAYSGAVPPYMANAFLGGSNLRRPYVSVDASGGQANLGNVHAPHFHSVTNTEVRVTLGNVNAKHAALGEASYVAAAFLYDQSGSPMGMAEQQYSQATDHQFIFSGLNLTLRGVKGMRVVVLDTLNGYFQGFHTL